jgi:hypothetical protein
MQTEAEIVGRNVKRQMCWLRVPHRYSHKILTLPDSVIPYGMKSATKVLIEWDGKVETVETGYYAEVEVIEDISEQERSPSDN